MIDLLIAYDIAELEKKTVLKEAENLYRSGLLNDDQRQKIGEVYASKLYTPSLFMKVLLFVFSLLGMTTVIGPITAIIGDVGQTGFQFLALFLGICLIFFTEKVLIKIKFHFNSGITEAGIFSGLLFIAFGILGSQPNNGMVYPIVGFLLAAFAAIRYLNLFALVFALGFFVLILFKILTAIGGVAEALIPFVFMATFGLLYWYFKKLQKILSNVIFEKQFVLLKTISLLFFYVAGNYFVVRELSIRLMGLKLSGGDNIPFAFLFYLFTALVPVGYLYGGIRKKSILLIRVGLLTTALSVITFKYYFSLGPPVITITVSGIVLITIALTLLNYLKQMRGGFTREQLIIEKWSSQDLAAIIASQTLGGNKTSETVSEEPLFNGGRFGGGGAGGSW